MIVSSAKPRKQRLFRYTAPMHMRQHFLHAHIDKKLREKLQIKMRSVQIRRGDSVRVVAGSNKGKEGKVVNVSLRSGRIEIDSLKRKSARGKEFGVKVSVNSVCITDLNLDDKLRAAKLNVQAKGGPKPQRQQEVPTQKVNEDVEKPLATQKTVATVAANKV